MNVMSKRNLLILFSCLLFSSVQGQSYMKRLPPQKITVNEPDHTVVAELHPAKYLKADKEKFYAWVSGNKIVFTQGEYSGKLLNGKYQDFYTNKNLKESGQYVNGLKDGEWKSWDQDGFLKDSYRWVMGLKQGKFYKYDSTGRVIEKGRYNRGELSGKFHSLTADSTNITHYKKGVEVEKRKLSFKFIDRWFNLNKEQDHD